MSTIWRIHNGREFLAIALGVFGNDGYSPSWLKDEIK